MKPCENTLPIPEEHLRLYSSLQMENTGDRSTSAACVLEHQPSSKQNAADGYVAYLQCYSVQLLSKAHCRLLVALRAGDYRHVTNNEVTQDVR